MSINSLENQFKRAIKSPEDFLNGVNREIEVAQNYPSHDKKRKTSFCRSLVTQDHGGIRLDNCWFAHTVSGFIAANVVQKKLPVLSQRCLRAAKRSECRYSMACMNSHEGEIFLTYKWGKNPRVVAVHEVASRAINQASSAAASSSSNQASFQGDELDLLTQADIHSVDSESNSSSSALSYNEESFAAAAPPFEPSSSPDSQEIVRIHRDMLQAPGRARQIPELPIHQAFGISPFQSIAASVTPTPSLVEAAAVNRSPSLVERFIYSRFVRGPIQQMTG